MFALLGILLGVFMGLVPGVHPNMIILLVPLLVSLDIGPLSLVAMITAMGVTNSVVDFIPSILLGAPEGGSELSVLPGHKLLLGGFGYDAVKLTVIGSIGSLLVVLLLLPVMALAIPMLFDFARPVIYLFLLFIVLLMILTEGGEGKIYAALLFLASGTIGLQLDRFPVDSTLALFPVFSGFFGISMLVLQTRSRTKIAKQRFSRIAIGSRLRNRSILLGSLGGIFSGFLPGVGSSEVATLATVDKNDKSFLVTLGALTTANIIFSILTLWLISRPRSGVAVAISQVAEIGLPEVLVIIAVCMLSVGVGSIVTLRLAGVFVIRLEKINYTAVSRLVIAAVVGLVFFFTGFFGLLLLVTATALGILASMLGVKRGNLMGILILPTMLFYAGL